MCRGKKIYINIIDCKRAHFSNQMYNLLKASDEKKVVYFQLVKKNILWLTLFLTLH